MVNTLKNIEFSYGSLTFLNEQTEQVQNTILGAIFKAVVSDLSVLEHKRLEQMNNPYRAVLSVDEELRVVFRLDDDKIYVMDIVTADYFESFSLYNEIFISSISFMEALGYKYPNLMEKRTMEFIVNSCKLDSSVKIIVPSLI